jgi:hypothetical protein
MGDQPWVGTCWTPHGHPDPEALILEDRIKARHWVIEPIGEVPPSRRTSSMNSELAVFPARSAEYVVEAHMAKVIR